MKPMAGILKGLILHERYVPSNGVPLELQDVAYYNMVKFCDLQDKYALDSETDFNKFASDHYGELGLLRLNISHRILTAPDGESLFPTATRRMWMLR